MADQNFQVGDLVRTASGALDGRCFGIVIDISDADIGFFVIVCWENGVRERWYRGDLKKITS